MADEQQTQRVNQAAEEFASALKESYQTMASRGESAYDLNAQLTEQFFNSVVNNLQTQAEANRQTGEQLAEQAQRGQEASRQLTQESVQAYKDFISSMFAFPQAGTQAAERGTIEAQETPTPTEASPEIEGYDSLNIEEITEKLDDLSTEELRQLRAYEAENKSRSTLLRPLDERIEEDDASSS